MKKSSFLLSLFIFFSLIAAAQKADFKAAEKFRADNLTPKYGDLSVNPNWIEESDIFWYSFKTSSGKNYYYVNAGLKTKQPLFDSRFMAAELRKITHHPYNDLDLPIKDIKFEKKSTSKFTFMIDSIKFMYDMTSQKLEKKDTIRDKKNPSWPTYSPDSTWIAYSKNHNLFLMKAKDKDSVEIQLTTDGERYYSFSRNSEDTTKNKKTRAAIEWFKNSKKLYIERQDERKVKDLFVIDILAQPRPKLETYRYSMPGEEFVPQSELIVFDVASKARVNVDLKKWKDQTINVFWTSQKAADKLIVMRKDRPLKNYTRLSVLNEGNDIIWWSERTGWGQLYLYDSKGNLKNQITNGYFVTGRVERIDTLGRNVYFEAFGKEQGVHPYYSMKYKASIDRGGMTLITNQLIIRFQCQKQISSLSIHIHVLIWFRKPYFVTTLEIL